MGELYVATGCLGSSHPGHPALTAFRLIADPYGRPGERMFRAGPLGGWTASGDLVLTPFS